jgi:hypothetical protein
MEAGGVCQSGVKEKPAGLFIFLSSFYMKRLLRTHYYTEARHKILD